MRLRTRRTGAVIVTAALGAAGLAAALSGSSAGAQPSQSTLVCDFGTVNPVDGAREFALETRDGYIQTPDGNTVYMWGYAKAGGAFQAPGPTLCADQGDTVRVTLTNPADDPTLGPTTLTGGIPAATTSIVFPGQSGVTATGGQPGLLTNEITQSPLGGPADTVTYEFVAAQPGTYLYQSGSDPAVQIQMGLYGGLVIYPTEGRNFVYAGKEFDTRFEYLLLFHEVDPDLHAVVELEGDVANYDPTARHNRYWTINGRAMPDTVAPNFAPTLPSQPYSSLVEVQALDPADTTTPPALVRYGTAGLDNHPFHPHGNHLRLVGQDGRPLPDEIEAYTKTVAAGQTFELLAEWRDVEAWQGTGAPEAVNIPVLDNLVFKDGVTWYSGDEDLGQQQLLPNNVTSFSECGEYYFPWHSHALDSNQNFDEAFGGMLTLWRVDPPGGCPA